MIALERRFFVGIMVLGIAYYYRSIEGWISNDAPIVKTRYGIVRGQRSESRQGRTYYEFLGIPYAKPPVGDLRFEAPQRPLKWDGVRDATRYGSQCLQLEMLLGLILGDEDCLFLNIMTPYYLEHESGSPNGHHKMNNQSRKLDGKLLPVMVYIHGGLFINGGSDLWRGSYFMDNDVILVTLNYRLAALGFLSTGADGIVRGNQALKDQAMALRFVKENIKAFGGDPERITVFGESAGGVGAHFQMLSPMSKGLFSRVISQSGSAFHFWTLSTDPAKQARRLGSLLGCPTQDTKEMVKCLKNVEASAIVDIHREIMDPLRDHVTIFKPTVEFIDDEQAFITKPPHEIVASGNFSQVPWIAGMNSDEGLITAAAIMANATMTDLAQHDWNDFVRKLLVFQPNDEAAQKIRNFYFNKSDITTFDNLHSYAQMISDRGFFADIHHGARLQSQSASSPVYLYFYSYPGEWTVANLFMEVRGTLPRLMEAGWAILSSCNSWLHNWINKTLLGRTLPNYGASHSDELALLFQMPWISDVLEDSKDYQMSIDLVKLWVSFASQEENENMNLTFRGVHWEPVSANKTGSMYYLNIDAVPKMIPEPFTKRIEFWESLNLTNA